MVVTEKQIHFQFFFYDTHIDSYLVTEKDRGRNISLHYYRAAPHYKNIKKCCVILL